MNDGPCKRCLGKGYYTSQNKVNLVRKDFPVDVDEKGDYIFCCSNCKYNKINSKLESFWYRIRKIVVSSGKCYT